MGADGVLGSALREHLASLGDEVVGTTRRKENVDNHNLYLDLQRPPESWVLPPNVDAAILCAGVTRLQACRTHPEASIGINVGATAALARKLVSSGAYVIFPSTNLVFNGQRPAVPPDAEPDPRTEYGRQKVAAERLLLSLDRTLCLRITKILTRHNPLFGDWVRSLRANQPIFPFSDKVDAPVPLSYVVQMISSILRHRPAGIMQISGTSDLSYECMARIGARTLGANEGLIQAVTTADKDYREHVPANTTLSTADIVELTAVAPPPVNETVASVFAAEDSATQTALLVPCHVCGGGLHEVPCYTSLKRVTSDCKPWSAGGHLSICEDCHCVQKQVDATWKADVGWIYREYSIYHQGEGAEQRIFDGSSSVPRSDAIVRKLQCRFAVPDTGRLLDFGCGNGAFLRSFSKLFSRWRLEGAELDEKHREEILAIPGVEQFHADASCGSVEGTFDLISMVHVLEHVADPVKLLQSMGAKLAPGGRLLVQVPNWESNPFDLVIVDHSTHFTTASLAQVGRRAGLVPVAEDTNWVPKEITMVFTAAPDVHSPSTRTEVFLEKLASVGAAVRWLDETWRMAAQHADRTTLGLFGTSIAATWLFAQLEGEVGFFVDEARERVGLRLFGRPVMAPEAVDAGYRVFVGLAPSVAEVVCGRLQGKG